MFLKKILICFIALTITNCSDAKFLKHGGGSSTPVQTFSFATTKIGGGGFARGLDFICDATCVTGGTSTKTITTDSSGAYYSNPAATCGNDNHAGCWQRVDNATSMPSADLNLNYASFRGSLEMRVAPTNTSRWYLLYSMDGTNATAYFSTDKGSHWTHATTFSNFVGTPNDNPQRLQGPILSVDPNNELVAIAGSRSAGAQKTTNGGVTWSAVSGITNANGNNVIIIYDQTSLHNCGGGSDTCGVYLSSAGTGIYHSGDGGSTWTLLSASGMPTSVNRMIVDQNSLLWVVTGPSGGGTLKTYNGSVWTPFSQLAGQANVIAVSPQNANIVVLLTEGSGGVISFDGGSTWTSTFSGPGTGVGGVTRVANDIPWLQATMETFMTNSDIKFDPAATQWTTCASSCTNSIAASGTASWTTVSTMGLATGTVVTAYQTSNHDNRLQGTVTSNVGTNLQIALTASNGSGTNLTDWTIGTMKLYLVEGIGVWNTNLPISFSTQALTWTSFTAGIENLVPRWISSPWGASACSTLGTATSVPILTSEDRPAFLLKNQTIYPSRQEVNNNQSPPMVSNQAIAHGWAADWAGQAPQNLTVLIGNFGFPASSSDCGATWSTYGQSGSTTLFAGFNGLAGGSIAQAATDTNNVAVIQGNTLGGYYTTDGGVNWNLLVFPGVPNSGTLNTSASGISPLTFASIPTWLSNGIALGTTYTFFTSSNSSGTITGVSGNTLTTSGTSGSVSSGDKIFFQSNNGFNPNSGFTNMHILVADKVTDHTFYAKNEGVGGITNSAGFYRSTDSGATWTQRCINASTPTTCPGAANGPLTAQVRTTPNNAGDLWYTRGPNFGTSHPSAQGFYHSTDGAATFSQPNSNVQEVWAFGFGKPKPGNTYPTIYIYGWVTNIDATWPHVYRSDDQGVTYTNLSGAGEAGAFPNGIIDGVTTIEGDANIYGNVYVGFGGSGWATGALH